MSSAVAPMAHGASLLPSPAPRRHVEDDLQRSFMQFLGPALGPRGVAYAIPNGGKRHAREAARMKGLGVAPGIPDIGICYEGRALFVEVKAPRGVLSDAQRDMHKRLNYAGAAVMVCRSVEELEAQLREACVPLRATVMAAIMKTPQDGPGALQRENEHASTCQTPAADLGATDAGRQDHHTSAVGRGASRRGRRLAPAPGAAA